MNKMKRMACFVLAAALGCFCAHATAEQTNATNTTNATNSIAYAVRAILPDNQIDTSVSNFNLAVSPGDRQRLQVTVMNRGTEDITVAVEANTAFSNQNGVIEYSSREERDASMQVDFSSIVVPVEPVITVPANGEAIAEFLLTVPMEPFDGLVHGGLMFTKQGQDENPEAEGGIIIHNVYRYVIGVRLSESQTPVAPEFELLGAEIGKTGDHNTLVLQIRNPKPVIAKDISLQIQVYPAGASEPALDFERSSVAMAPNTLMHYTIYTDEVLRLEAGEYLVKVKLQYEDKTWEMDTPLSHK